MKVIMNVAGVFQINGLGLVVTGCLKENVSVGDEVQVFRQNGSVFPVKIVNIKHYNASLSSANAGSDVALVLEGIACGNVAEGDLIGVGSASVSHKSFMMRVEDKFIIKGRGAVVTGIVASGVVAAGDIVRLMRQNASALDLIVGGIEHKGALADRAEVGEDVGLLFEGLDFDMVEIGDVVIGK